MAAGGGNSSKLVKLYLTSNWRDFHHERLLFNKEILPEIQPWCKSKGIELRVTDFRWGGKLTRVELNSLLKDIEPENDVHLLFINISSTSLGLVPFCGETPLELINKYSQWSGLNEKEIEILSGAYRNDDANVIFLLRDDSFLSELTDTEQRYFPAAGSSSDQLKDLVIKNIERFPIDKVQYYRYDASGWDFVQGSMLVEINKTFKKQILDFLRCRLSQFIDPTTATCDECVQMQMQQETAVSLIAEKVRGTDDYIIRKILEYVECPEKDVPLLILGPQGSGKTSVLAKAVEVLLTRNVEMAKLRSSSLKRPKIIYHFCGVVPLSTEVRLLLERLCRELLPGENCAGRNVSQLAQRCRMALSSADSEPVIIILDNTDKLQDGGNPVLLNWVRRKLGPCVRCIISLDKTTSSHYTQLMDQESKPIQIELNPLNHHIKMGIVDSIIPRSSIIRDDQIQDILFLDASSNPLWLTIVCEEIMHIMKLGVHSLQDFLSNIPTNLVELFVQVLTRLENGEDGHLVEMTMCLLMASGTGLYSGDLILLLGQESETSRISPYEEKEEKETSEKESKKMNLGRPKLDQTRFDAFYHQLQRYLLPYCKSNEGKLHIYYGAMQEAVKKKYFKMKEGETELSDESKDISHFWHKKLADFFENTGTVERKIEEYMHHLCVVEDEQRLRHCLCDWKVFDILYNDLHSKRLLEFWAEAGGYNEMIDYYKAALDLLSEKEPKDEDELALRHEHVARVFLQAGKYSESLELTCIAMKLEEKELGKRSERMVELQGLMAEIFDEKLKLNDFVSPSQIPDLRKTIDFGRKSIELRKNFQDENNKFKLGLSLMKLAFSLESWEACGGDSNLTGEEALNEGKKCIDEALTIFKELDDEGHYAEALMTKGVLAQRGSSEQLKCYNEAMDICRQVYGEKSLLMSRLYINIGIVWEDNHDYVKAYDFFKRWARISADVLGPDHPKTMRAKGVLKEARYKLVAARLVERETNHNNSVVSNESIDSNMSNQLTDEEINSEIRQLEESPVQELDNSQLGEELTIALGNLSDNELVTAAEEIQDLYAAFNDLFQRVSQAQTEETEEMLENIMNQADLLEDSLITVDHWTNDNNQRNEEHNDNNHENNPENNYE